MGGIRVDDSRFPIVISTFAGDLRPDHVHEYASEFRKILERNQRFIVIADGRECKIFDNQVRKAWREYLKETNAYQQRLCIGTALVVGSPFFKTMLMGLLVLARSQMLLTAFVSMEEAIRWARMHLDLETEDEGPV